MTDTLREWAKGRVETAVGGQLGSAGGIVPATVAAENDDLDPRVAVGASLDDSERANLRQAETGTVRIIVDGTKTYVETEGTLALTDIQWAIHDELTKQDPDWRDPSLQQMDEVAWDDDLNRYLGVQQYSVKRSRIHPHY